MLLLLLPPLAVQHLGGREGERGGWGEGEEFSVGKVERGNVRHLAESMEELQALVLAPDPRLLRALALLFAQGGLTLGAGGRLEYGAIG